VIASIIEATIAVDHKNSSALLILGSPCGGSSTSASVWVSFCESFCFFFVALDLVKPSIVKLAILTSSSC